MTDLSHKRIRQHIDFLHRLAKGRREASLMTFEGKPVGHPDAERYAVAYENCAAIMEALAISYERGKVKA